MKQNQKSDRLVSGRLVSGGLISDNLILYTSLVSFGLLITTLASFSFLSSTTVSAEDIVDEINITVPVSCTMSGNGESSHNAEILNGHYDSNIGETTMKAYCNDGNGFAIYAIGYTDNEDGKNVLTDSTLGNTYDIATGTLTSGNTSNWAMKLSTITDPAPTYPIAIQSDTEGSFSSFHTVPDNYTLVAKRTAGTDIGSSAEGSTLKSTYQAYISQTQPAGSYAGQVKYTLVHPHTAPGPVGENQIGIIYHGNGLYFDQAEIEDTNKVVFERNYEDEYGYVGDTPTIMKTRNLNADGTKNGPYSEEGGNYYEGDGLNPSWAEFEGASRIKLVAQYGLTAYNTFVDLNIDGGLDDACGELCDSNIDRAGTVIITGSGSYVSIYSELGASAINPGYDYGIYAQAYPVYDEPTEGASYGLVRGDVLSLVPVSGAYEETTTWNGYWYYYTPEGDVRTFWNEDDVKDYLKENADSLAGATIDLYAGNSYTVVFDANGGSGTMTDQIIYPYLDTYLDEASFTKPHQEVISWNTEPDGTGESYSLQGLILDPIANTGIGDTVTLYAQWGVCSPKSICYDDNGANSPTSMEKHYYSSNTNTHHLWASNFQRAGYGFAGWNTKADGTGTNYGPNQLLDSQNTNSNADFDREGIRLYAKWVQSAGNLQGWTGCSNLSIGDVTALTDTRDNNTYAVSRLADGNCWMIENLRLGSSSDMSLTTADTQSAGTLPAASTTGYGARVVRNDNTISPVVVMSNKASNVYSYGNYYGWRAAINSTIYTAGTNNTSICPSGWHLPYGGSGTDSGGGNTSGGFYYLGQIIGDANFKHYPNNFILSGYSSHYISYINDRGYAGEYWSATYGSITGSNVSAYQLQFFSEDHIATYDSGLETIGASVRCVMNK